MKKCITENCPNMGDYFTRYEGEKMNRWLLITGGSASG